MVEKNMTQILTSIFQGLFKDVVFRSVRKNIQAIPGPDFLLPYAISFALKLLFLKSKPISK